MRMKEKQPTPPPPTLSIEAAGQRYAQTAEFRYLGGFVNEQGDLARKINLRSKAAWACFKVRHGALRPAGSAVSPQDPPTPGGGGGGTAVRLHDMVSTPRPLPIDADDTPQVVPASHRIPVLFLRPFNQEGIPQVGNADVPMVLILLFLYHLVCLLFFCLE